MSERLDLELPPEPQRFRYYRVAGSAFELPVWPMSGLESADPTEREADVRERIRRAEERGRAIAIGKGEVGPPEGWTFADEDQSGVPFGKIRLRGGSFVVESQYASMFSVAYPGHPGRKGAGRPRQKHILSLMRRHFLRKMEERYQQEYEHYLGELQKHRERVKQAAELGVPPPPPPRAPLPVEEDEADQFVAEAWANAIEGGSYPAIKDYQDRVYGPVVQKVEKTVETRAIVKEEFKTWLKKRDARQAEVAAADADFRLLAGAPADERAGEPPSSGASSAEQQQQPADGDDPDFGPAPDVPERLYRGQDAGDVAPDSEIPRAAGAASDDEDGEPDWSR